MQWVDQDLPLAIAAVRKLNLRFDMLRIGIL